MTLQQMKVQFRNIDKIKPEGVQLDGKVFAFKAMYELTQDDTSIYVGETAMMPVDSNYPEDAPTWIASGDLVAA